MCLHAQSWQSVTIRTEIWHFHSCQRAFTGRHTTRMCSLFSYDGCWQCGHGHAGNELEDSDFSQAKLRVTPSLKLQTVTEGELCLYRITKNIPISKTTLKLHILQPFPAPWVETVYYAFGTIMWTYGCLSPFPTVGDNVSMCSRCVMIRGECVCVCVGGLTGWGNLRRWGQSICKIYRFNKPY